MHSDETISIKSKKKTGVPPKKIDWEMVDTLLRDGCLTTEIAATLGVCTDTIYNACVREKGTTFSAYSQEKKAIGERLLRSVQFQHAVKDRNTTMLIWLGKQRLGQRENEQVSRGTPEQNKDIDALMAQIKGLQSQLERRIDDISSSTESKS